MPIPKQRNGANAAQTNGEPTAPDLRPLAARINALGTLVGKLCPIPDEWRTQAAQGLKTGSSNRGVLRALPCTSYKELVLAWRKALKWTDNLDCALSVMLACVASTTRVGEQLWVKILGPPSSGKTTLLEGLSVNTKYVLSKSVFTGFHSGFKSGDGKDISLTAKADGMTLAIKDGDTLLKAPNKQQILSEARDLYDRNARTQYRNKEGNDYTNHRMTWILCGTSALREIDESELGARFLDCVVMDGIDGEFEEEVGWRAAFQEDRNLATEAGGEDEQYSPELSKAMQLTGGYVSYLREIGIKGVDKVANSDDSKRHCVRLGTFIAYMRARPHKRDREAEQEREFSARLIKQCVRLAKCTAIVLNKDEVDEEVLRRTTKIAMDTSRGISLKIVTHLARAEHGLNVPAIAMYTGYSEEQIRKMIRFLKSIEAVEVNKDALPSGAKTKLLHYRLTARLKDLYSHVEGD